MYKAKQYCGNGLAYEMYLIFLWEENKTGSLICRANVTAQNSMPMWGEAFDVFSELPFKLAFTTCISI